MYLDADLLKSEGDVLRDAERALLLARGRPLDTHPAVEAAADLVWDEVQVIILSSAAASPNLAEGTSVGWSMPCHPYLLPRTCSADALTKCITRQASCHQGCCKCMSTNTLLHRHLCVWRYQVQNSTSAAPAG